MRQQNALATARAVLAGLQNGSPVTLYAREALPIAIALVRELGEPELADGLQAFTYPSLALAYAERHGIIDYTVNGSQLTYHETFPREGTHRATVNLDTMTETREAL